MHIVQSAPQGVDYHVDVTNLLPKLGIKAGTRSSWFPKLCQHQLGSPLPFFMSRWIVYLCILYQLFDAHVIIVKMGLFQNLTACTEKDVYLRRRRLGP